MGRAGLRYAGGGAVAPSDWPACAVGQPAARSRRQHDRNASAPPRPRAGSPAGPQATDVEGSHLRATIAVTARDKLLVFLTRRDVEATNNESERALRPSVIFRRVTNGFRSEWGAKVYADLCSVVATGRLAGRSALAAIRDALAAPAPERTAA
jgi:Transposase IS66 family